MSTKFVVLAFMVWLTIVGSLSYVALHFILKFW